MGVKTLISPEEYLSTQFDYEPEYVQGELRERPMPTRTRAEIVALLLEIFNAALKRRGYRAAPEVRSLMPNGNYRLPDVMLFSPDAPREEVPTYPPPVVVEVLSNDHRHNELLEKLQDYELWRVPNIWIVNPRFHTLEVFKSGQLHRVEALTLPEHDIEIRRDDLADSI